MIQYSALRCFRTAQVLQDTYHGNEHIRKATSCLLLAHETEELLLFLEWQSAEAFCNFVTSQAGHPNPFGEIDITENS